MLPSSASYRVIIIVVVIICIFARSLCACEYACKGGARRRHGFGGECLVWEGRAGCERSIDKRWQSCGHVAGCVQIGANGDRGGAKRALLYNFFELFFIYHGAPEGGGNASATKHAENELRVDA
jgi:hypothetical protein